MGFSPIVQALTRDHRLRPHLSGMETTGVAAARSLFGSENLEAWSAALARYPQSLAAKGGPALVELDRWLREDFPKEALNAQNSLKPQGLSPALLEKTVSWKLKRGKFRPLMGMVKSNSPSAVKHGRSSSGSPSSVSVSSTGAAMRSN